MSAEFLAAARRAMRRLFRLRSIRNEQGQAVVEYAIVFPVQLLLTLTIIQLAHLFIARQVLEYGAFCAARAALVEPQGSNEAMDAAVRAAVIPISRIAGPSGVTAPDDITIPGWGLLTGSGAAAQKTEIVYLGNDSPDPDHDVMRCNLEHDYELRVPIGGAVVYTLGDVALSDQGLDVYRIDDAPHILMKASCTLAYP